MAKRTFDLVTRPLSDEECSKLAEGLKPISRNELAVFRGAERQALLSIKPPAHGRLSAHAIRLLGECAKRRKLDSRYPNAVRFLKGGLPGVILMEPVGIYDPAEPDQHELRWYHGKQRVSIDLIHVLQPLGLEAPSGFIAEMPIVMQELPDSGVYLVIYANAPKLRARRNHADEPPAADTPPGDTPAAPEET